MRLNIQRALCRGWVCVEGQAKERWRDRGRCRTGGVAEKNWYYWGYLHLLGAIPDTIMLSGLYIAVFDRYVLSAPRSALSKHPITIVITFASVSPHLHPHTSWQMQFQLQNLTSPKPLWYFQYPCKAYYWCSILTELSILRKGFAWQENC